MHIPGTWYQTALQTWGRDQRQRLVFVEKDRRPNAAWRGGCFPSGEKIEINERGGILPRSSMPRRDCERFI